MESFPSRDCAYCGVEKVWKWTGKKLKDGSKIYVDDRKARWAGRRCPTCEKERVQAAVKCDSFRKDIIMSQLKEEGYEIDSSTLPLKVSKEGKVFSVSIQCAHTEKGDLILEKDDKESADLYAIVFESVRVLPAAQIDKLRSKIRYFKNIES